MTNKKAEAVKLIGLIHQENPTLNIGTILQSAIDLKKGISNFDISDVSDKEVVAALTGYREKLLTSQNN